MRSKKRKCSRGHNMAAIEATKGSLQGLWPLLWGPKLWLQTKKFSKRSVRHFMGCQEENSSGKYHLGSQWNTLTIFLKTFPKATKLGSLFPKVKNDLSFFSNPPFEVRAENECKISFKHLVQMQTRCLMNMQPRWTPLEGVQTASKYVSDTFLRWTICPPHSIPESFVDGKHQKT